MGLSADLRNLKTDISNIDLFEGDNILQLAIAIRTLRENKDGKTQKQIEYQFRSLASLLKRDIGRFKNQLSVVKETIRSARTETLAIQSAFESATVNCAVEIKKYQTETKKAISGKSLPGPDEIVSIDQALNKIRDIIADKVTSKFSE